MNFSAIDPSTKSWIAYEIKGELSYHKLLWNGDYFTNKQFEYVNRSIIEKVHSMPGQGVSSSFKFGSSYGQCLQILYQYSDEFIMVTPQAWKKYYNILLPGASKKEKKQLAIEKCKEISGIITKDDNLAESILLLFYLKSTTK